MRRASPKDWSFFFRHFFSAKSAILLGNLTSACIIQSASAQAQEPKLETQHSQKAAMESTAANAEGKGLARVSLDAKDCTKFRSLLKRESIFSWSSKTETVQILASAKECAFSLNSAESSELVRIHRGYPNTFIVSVLDLSDRKRLMSFFRGKTLKFRTEKEFRSATINEKIFATPQVELTCSVSESCTLVLTPGPKNP